MPVPDRRTPLPWLKVPRAVAITIVWVVLALLTLWAVAALFVDFRIPALRIPLTLLYVLGVITIFVKLRRSRWAAVAYVAGFCIVLAWWLTPKPSNDGNWQSNVDRPAWAEIVGDRGHYSQFTQLRLSHRNRLCGLLERTDHLSFTDPGCRPISDELGDSLCEPPDSQLS